MKKILILSGIFFAAGMVYASPNIDVSAGGMPFRLIQETIYEEQEMDDMKNRQEDMKFLNRIKKPASIKLQRPNSEYHEQQNVPSNVQFVEEDGKVIIKPVQ